MSEGCVLGGLSVPVVRALSVVEEIALERITTGKTEKHLRAAAVTEHLRYLLTPARDAGSQSERIGVASLQGKYFRSESNPGLSGAQHYNVPSVKEVGTRSFTHAEVSFESEPPDELLIPVICADVIHGRLNAEENEIA